MVSVKCPLCAGKRPFCIHKSYPLPKNFSVEKQVKEKLKKDFFGPSYNVFVGHYGYPSVNIGPMSSLEGGAPGPLGWFGKDYQEIITQMSLVVRARQKQGVFSRSRIVSDVQELALAKKPADTEISYRKQPHFRFVLSDSLQPMGPTGELEKLRLAENVKIEPRVERIVTDELKAAEASLELYKTGQDNYKISTILSAGLLGQGDKKKIVPTRWSLTGVQDIIAKKLMIQIRTYPQINEYMIFESKYLDNKFIILLMPGAWEFENFETWAPGSNWSYERLGIKNWKSRIIEEYEPFKGRTKYADKQVGGYYCTRLGVCEALQKMRRQARVIGFREIYEGYVIPVGSWQILENVRNAFRGPCKKFTTREEAISYTESKLRVPLSAYIKNSRILQQKKLSDFSHSKFFGSL